MTIRPASIFFDDSLGVYVEVQRDDGLGGDIVSIVPAATTTASRTNRDTVATKARQAISDNITSIGQIPAAIGRVQAVIDGTATNLNQANVALDELAVVLRGLLSDYERMLRQLVAVERLLIGSDLLDDTAGT